MPFYETNRYGLNQSQLQIEIRKVQHDIQTMIMNVFDVKITYFVY